MASNHTENYGLCQWEATDKVLRTDFNEDNAKIDGALAQKADTTALEALAGTVSALSQSRNCQFQYLPYTGAGELSLTLTFAKQPVFLIIVCNQSNLCLVTVGNCTNASAHGAGSSSAVAVTRSGNSITLTHYSHTQYNCNQLGASYHAFAILDAT